MAGIVEVIAATERAIAGVVPRFGSARFRPKATQDGISPYDWLRMPARAHRDFTIEPMTMSETGACWLTAELDVAIVYRAELTTSDVVPYEDAGAIARALRDPANWSTNTATTTPVLADKLEIVDVAGRPATRILHLTVKVDYYENP